MRQLVLEQKLNMIDIYSLALGLHTRDRIHGVVLWDVDFDELTDEKILPTHDIAIVLALQIARDFGDEHNDYAQIYNRIKERQQ
jgi:hypothetical protein